MLFRLAANLHQLPERFVYNVILPYLQTYPTYYLYVCSVLIVQRSTAQLLEPFCREYDIRMSLLGPEIEGRPSTIHPNVMHHAPTPTVSSGGELEDPPGLYEKVG